MFGKETGSVTKDATITKAGSIEVAGEPMSNGSMDYLQKNKSTMSSDAKKVRRSKIKK